MSKILIAFLAVFIACGFFIFGGLSGWMQDWKQLEHPKESILISLTVLGIIVCVLFLTGLGYWYSSKILGAHP
jgi:succinate dehydrogenase/fumarate reductase cytochrome b subunit